MKLVNLTPHEIHETVTGKKFPASGQIARVAVKYVEKGGMNGIPVFEVEYGEVEGLPPKKRGTRYIVSSLVLESMKGKRRDLLAPGELVRDQNGQPFGCMGFKK